MQGRMQQASFASQLQPTHMAMGGCTRGPGVGVGGWGGGNWAVYVVLRDSPRAPRRKINTFIYFT